MKLKNFKSFKLNEKSSSEILSDDEVFDYMVKECGIECLRDVASDNFGRDYSDCDESQLYHELWSRGYLTQFIEKFGSAYYNLYKSDYYGIANTMVEELENETGKVYKWSWDTD